MFGVGLTNFTIACSASLFGAAAIAAVTAVREVVLLLHALNGLQALLGFALMLVSLRRKMQLTA